MFILPTARPDLRSRSTSLLPLGLAAIIAGSTIISGCDTRQVEPLRQPEAPLGRASANLAPSPDPSLATTAQDAEHGLHPGKKLEPSAPSAAPGTLELYDEQRYLTTAIKDADRRALVVHGKALATETWRHLGAGVGDPAKRKIKSGLACKNCHLKAGLQPFSAPWVGVTKRYPSFRDRANRVGTIEDRINGCMERSMNGEPLSAGSRDMRALVAWMEWLSRMAPADGAVFGAGFEVFPFPDRAVDQAHGKSVFATRCAACHGAEGTGVKNPAGGYLFPPVAGDRSYNDGAGMNRVLTAAAFILNNMPQGTTYRAPQLTVEEAYDVAGYVDSLSRPKKPDLDADYPARELKPMSTPYGPWADDFSAAQHKYGPFGPIQAHYAQEHAIRKKR